MEMPGRAPSQLSRVAERIGTSTAQRKGLLRAAAEQSISQPTAGRAQAAYTGTTLSAFRATRK